MSTRIVVVGGGGAARAFRTRLATRSDYIVTVLTRAPEAQKGSEAVIEVEDDFLPPPDALRGADVVVNFSDLVSANFSLLHAVNADGIARLAAAAKHARVRHLVHISSLSVYGRAIDIDGLTPEMPISAYGHSKLAGDRALASVADENFMITSLRVPMLYSRECHSKLHTLVRILSSMRYFPVPRRCEFRSVLHLANLAGAIEVVIDTRLGGIRFAADPELFQLNILPEMFAQRGRAIRTIPLPASVFSLLRALSSDTYASLYGRSVIASKDCVPIPDARSLRSGLVDLFS